MAESSFRLPGSLNVTDGNVAENFKRWKREYEVYMTATGSDKKDKKIQTAILLHCAGPQVLEIYDQSTWEDNADKDDPEKVLGKLETYCNPRKNEVLESHRFWTAPYQEPFDVFVTDLRKRVTSCNFTDADRMIRDKIVFTTTGKLQELLLREDDLNLTKAIKIGRAFEQSQKHVQELREKPSDMSVNRLNTARPKSDNHSQKRQYKQYPTRPISGKAKQNAEHKQCDFCGKNHPPKKEKCPAWGKKCAKCGGNNHFKAKCRRDGVNSVQAENENGNGNDEFWLASFESRSKVMATMIVNDCEVKFQIDTGAEVNTINQKYVRKCQVKSNASTLKMWNKSTLKPLGEVTLPMKNPKTGSTHDVKFVVVPNDFQSLLGLKTVQEMSLININTDSFIGKVGMDLGDLGETKLHIENDAKPIVLPSRKIPLAIKDQVKSEIDTLVERGILIPVEEPTEWVNQMAVVRKANGKLRICLDPQPLNKVLKRERYRLTTFDDVLPNLNQAKVFTKLDVKEAFWHVRLNEESSKLTTMITPFGRYRWSRLPFGLNVSSEIFARRLNEALNGLDGTFVIADDIIVIGCGENEQAAIADNNRKLKALSQRCAEQNIFLNEEKKEIGKEITFHGHKITDKGVMPDEKKVEAIRKMPTPTNVTEVRKICGLAQYMAKFLPDLASTLEPMRKLTHKDAEWKWSEECETSFHKMKDQIANAPILVYFDPEKELVIQADSSQSGLGAVLMQDGQPIEFASRSLTTSERKWAQIEKEALAILYGLMRFDQYTYARKVIVQNDHKPLETILKKPLGQAPKRLQDIIMKLLRYDIQFQYVKGTDLVIADTLSRAYTETGEHETSDRMDIRGVEIGAFDQFPDARILELKRATAEDSSMQELQNCIVSGWQKKSDISTKLREYYPLRDTLSVQDGVIFKGEAIVIPKVLRREMLQRLHKAHLGFESMDRRARGTIYWPGMRNEIKEFAKNCVQCEDRKPSPQKETLKQHDDGQRPWDKVGSDLFEIQNRVYLIVVDYYTSFIEIDHLTAANSQQVIDRMKKHFARFGIPRELITDGGPQYTSREFREFTEHWGIQHHVTSPHHPASNGKAESAVKVMKTLIMKCHDSRSDPLEAILEQRNTPRADTKLSPAEMLMSRKPRTLLPSRVTVEKINESRSRRKETVKKWFDVSARDQRKICVGEAVYFFKQSKKPWQKGIIIGFSGNRYKVRSEDNGLYTRNRVHIRPTSVPVHIREQSPHCYGELYTDRHSVRKDVANAPATANTQETVNTPVTENAPVTENTPTSASLGESPTADTAPNTSPGRYYLRPRRDIQRPQHLRDYV